MTELNTIIKARVFKAHSTYLPMKFSAGDDGWIVAEFPTLPGCISQGKTIDEAVRNLAEAIQAVLTVRMQDREPRP